MKTKICFSIAVAILSSVVLSGCASRQLPPMDEGALSAKRWQVIIDAADGTEIAATVWQPELAAGETAPLMLHTHGFGLQRMDGRVGLYENVLYTGQVAKRLWKEGAWLITWDQRGHGDSGDKINLMEPDKEVDDVSRILDWAQQNIPRLKTVNGDPLVGMVGESYGGAVQMMASARDGRIDAIVPVTTWYDLDLALAPGDVPKGGWMTVLYVMGDWVNFRKLPGMLRSAFGDAKDGRINDQAREYLADNQMRHFCDNGQMPKANALIVSGLRDVLFNPLQGLAARDCFREAGRDVHLVINRDGHLLPSKQFSTELPGWAIDNTLYCADQPMDTEQATVDWLKSELGMGGQSALPAICVSLDKWGVAMAEWPDKGETVSFEPVQLRGNGSGRWEWLNAPRDWVANLATENRLREQFAHARDGGWRPAFVPLLTAEQDQRRIGTPVVTLAAEEDGVPVLGAIVVRRAGGVTLELAHQQVTPLRTGQSNTLPPVALELEAGDQLGLMLLSRHGQFNTLDLDFEQGLEFTGSVEVPLAIVDEGESQALSQR